MSRLSKVENIIRLIHQMSSSGQGISLPDIMAEYVVSRRTAERMLNLVREIYGSLLEVSITDNFHKAYKLPTLYRQGPVQFSQEELNALTSAINLAKRYKMDEVAQTIESLALRLRSLAKNSIKHNIEDLAELAEIGMLAGPHINVDPAILSIVNRAILSWQKLEVDYQALGNGEQSIYTICPYGILYGPRPYLVAYLELVGDYRYFSLTHIKHIKILDEDFIRDKSFSIKAYAEQSFGSYQETPYEVIWKVSPAKAAEAFEFRFHPTQTMELQADGSLLVKFKAGGLKEMCYHLFRWEGAIEIIAPSELKDMMRGMITKAQNRLVMNE